MAVPAWLLGLIPSMWNSAKEWIERKQKISELKTEAALVLEQKRIESAIRRVESADIADTKLDQTSLEQTGWKDEYLLILTTLPVVLLMASPFMDLFFVAPLIEQGPPGAPAVAESIVHFTYKEGMIAAAVDEGFSSLSKAPEYYWYALAAVYIHSLGMRRMFRLWLDKISTNLISK